jgi:hypothetical protein
MLAMTEWQLVTVERRQVKTPRETAIMEAFLCKYPFQESLI